jgi:Fe-S-cluster containining protein
MITDLVQIKLLGDKKRAENERFRQHLKRHGYIERNFRKIAANVEEQIDCRSCAQCCRQSTVRLLDRDVERLAKFLKVSWTRFLSDYTQESPDEGRILKRSDDEGCVFLSGNDCLVYEARPSNCSDFPHLIRGQGSFHSRMWDMIDRATYCPIVYHSLEAFKQETGFDAGLAQRGGG